MVILKFAGSSRSLVDSHIGQRSAGETSESGWIRRIVSDASASPGEVRRGNQSEQFLNCGGGYCCNLVLAGDCSGHRQLLMLANSFIGQEEEGFVLDEGAAQSGTEFVAFERCLGE